MEEALKEILTRLRRQMNGAVSQTMRELGQSNVLNLGVSLPTIKEISLDYAPNHELANELSARKMREAQIAALYIARPEMLTYDQMEQWSRNWENEEIARLSAMVLFHKSPDAEQIASEWLSAESPQCTSEESETICPENNPAESGTQEETETVCPKNNSAVLGTQEETETVCPKNNSADLRLKHLRNISALYIIGKQASKIDKDVITSMLESDTNMQTEAATYCLREIFLARQEFRDQIRIVATNNPELYWQIADNQL